MQPGLDTEQRLPEESRDLASKPVELLPIFGIILLSLPKPHFPICAPSMCEYVHVCVHGCVGEDWITNFSGLLKS